MRTFLVLNAFYLLQSSLIVTCCFFTCVGDIAMCPVGEGYFPTLTLSPPPRVAPSIPQPN